MSNKDVITAVLLSGRRVEWTTLRRRKSGYEVTEQKSVELDIPEKRAERDVSQWAAQIKQATGGIKGRPTVAVHTEHVLLRTVDLPSSDPDELAGMVELQVDKFSPFPIEHMAVSYESLGGSGGSSRVLIAACKRDVVEDLGALFAAMGSKPGRMDVVAAGWWQLIRDHGEMPTTGRHAILIVEETGTELVIMQNGLPVVVRALSAQHQASDEEFAAEVAEEASYTLTSIESEWGAMGVPDLTLWHRGEAPGLLAERLQTECAIQVKTHSLNELPPLTEGIARRDVLVDGQVLDLIPTEWKETESERKVQRRMIAMIGSVMVVWVLALSALFFLAHWDERRIEQLRTEIAAQEGPAEEARLLRRRVESLEQYADRTYSALECLREVTELLPQGVELSSFAYRKAGNVTLRGESPRVPPIYDFYEAMEASPLFIEVRPGGVTETPGGRRNPEFSITAVLPGEGS